MTHLHKRALFAVAVVLAGGCASSAPRIDDARAAYWVWRADDGWHLRATAGGHGHRFQGTVVGLTGSIADLVLTDAALGDRVAQIGDSVQFDFDAARGRPGFDFRVPGGCTRFDLLLDGKRRPERVHLGGSARTPPKVPFDRCP